MTWNPALPYTTPINPNRWQDTHMPRKPGWLTRQLAEQARNDLERIAREVAATDPVTEPDPTGQRWCKWCKVPIDVPDLHEGIVHTDACTWQRAVGVTRVLDTMRGK